MEVSEHFHLSPHKATPSYIIIRSIAESLSLNMDISAKFLDKYLYILYKGPLRQIGTLGEI